jgi:hypothetical protein
MADARCDSPKKATSLQDDGPPFVHYKIRTWLSSALEIKCDVGVDAIVCNFTFVHFSGEFLDVNRANVPQCFGGFFYGAPRGFLQPFGDCDNSSMTLTTFAMAIISFSHLSQVAPASRV